MTKKILNYFFIASVALSFVGIANTRVFAEGDAAPAEEGTVDLGFKLDNPLSSEVDTLPEFLYEIIHIFLIVGVPIVALAIIYCGFLFVIARGNSEKLSEAIALAAWLIVKTLLSSLGVESDYLADPPEARLSEYIV
jgi:hypothetical protein